MIECKFREIVDKNSDLVKDVERFELLREYQISKLKAKLKLLDGSILWVREIWIEGSLDGYSYYWLRSDGTASNFEFMRSLERYASRNKTYNRFNSTI